MRRNALSPDHRHPRGMALITAMLTVALIAALAASALWQQWRTLQVESAERQRQQALWLLGGALDWARLVLREDARSGSTDHLAEPWAVPLREARLSTFLASSNEGVSSEDASLADQVFLSGQITDLQSRLNVFNLVQGDQPSAPDVAAFGRLFELLGVPRSLLVQLVAQLQTSGGSGASSVRLQPQRLSQLTWMGLPPDQLVRLEPYITWLPARTPLNLNTARAEVLHAAIPGLGLGDAQRLVTLRDGQHWRTLDEATAAMGEAGKNLTAGAHQVSSQYFEVLGRVRLGSSEVLERSVIQRDDNLRILWRERGVLAMTPWRAPARAEALPPVAP